MSGRSTVLSGLAIVMGMTWSLPDSAEAQFPTYRRLDDRRLEAGVFLGGMSVEHDLGSVTNLFFTTTGQADDVSFGTDFYGGRISYDFTPNIAAEGTYSRSRQSFSLDVVNDVEAEDVTLSQQFETTVQNISGNVVAQFPLELGVTPYGTLGYAWVYTDPTGEIEGFTGDWSRGLNFGGGVKYFPPGAPWVGGRFDVRYQLLSEGLTFTDEVVEPRNTEVTIGVAFRF